MLLGKHGSEFHPSDRETTLAPFKRVWAYCWHNWFVYAEAHTGHGGRNKHRLFIPQINTSIGKNGFFYHGAVILNSLLPVLFTVNVLSNFKSI